MASTCSQCGTEGHNCQTGSEISGGAAVAEGGGKGFMLFGVRVMEEGSFRKSASMNNLAQFEQPQDSTNNDVNAGYASDDVVHPSARSRERKRGVPWTEEEHKLFLLGLQKVGKGDWRGISRNFVKTRTPTQVASHAQKYFLRRSNHSRRRRRSSLFDITTDTVLGSSMEEDESMSQPTAQQQKKMLNNPEKFPMSNYSVNLAPAVMLPATPVTGTASLENLSLGPRKNNNQLLKPTTTTSSTSGLIRPLPLIPVPPSSKMADLNMNKSNITDPLPLSLKLSTPSSPQPSSSEQQSSSPAAATRHASAFQGMPSGFHDNSGGDSIISVA